MPWGISMGSEPRLQPAETPGRWKQEARETFDHAAAHYATERERSPNFRAQLKIVLEMISGMTGRVLSIGCAAGGEFPVLRQRGFEIVGVDLAPQMLQYARHRFQEDDAIHVLMSDAEGLPFADQAFDLVLCLGVLEYLPDYSPALREMRRVLKPGGMMVLSVPSRVSQLNVAETIAMNTVAPAWRFAKRMMGAKRPPESERVPVHHRNLCLPWRLQGLLKSEGFDPASSTFSNFFLFPLSRLSPALNLKTAAALEPLRHVPVVSWMASQYLVAARRRG